MANPDFWTSPAGLKTEDVSKQVEEALEGMTHEAMMELCEKSVSEFTPGSIVKGRILGMAGDDVVIDIGYKSEGFVGQHEFEEGESIEAGVEVEVFLDAVEDGSGAVALSKRKADRIRGWERVIESHSVGDTVKGRCVRKIKGGLLVDIGVLVFLPASQVDIRRVGDVGEFIGREIDAKIIKIDENRRNIVISRRRLLEEDREKMKKELFGEIRVGEIRRGVVKNITDFGAFIDLGGVDGLLHITDMSWGRVNHPSEVVSVDSLVEVQVLDFNPERERISLGLKQLSSNPWETVPDRFPIGNRLTGEVVNIMPYGAFVKLEEGVEGLVHVSEMSWTKQINHPSEIVNVGDQVECVVLDLNADRQEISLGMKQTEANPWAKVQEQYPTGTKVTGKVRNLTNYGAFIEIEEGVDGLLHVSDMSWTKKLSHPSAMLKKGDEIEAVVLEVDQERKRVSLGLKQLEDDPWQTVIPERFSLGQTVKGTVTKLTSFGAFVELEGDLEGLLHISEMSAEKVANPEDVVKPDQEVEVKIINIDPVARKIGLSIKAMTEPDRKFDNTPSPSGPTSKVEASIVDIAKYRVNEVGGESLASSLSDHALFQKDESGEAEAEQEKETKAKAKAKTTKKKAAKKKEVQAEETATEESPAKEKKPKAAKKKEVKAEETVTEESPAKEEKPKAAKKKEVKAEETVTEETPAKEEKPKATKKKVTKKKKAKAEEKTEEKSKKEETVKETEEVVEAKAEEAAEATAE
jgi:small subunit ribosomal protein S1